MAAIGATPVVANRNNTSLLPSSPFFRPHTPRPRVTGEVITPGGTRHCRIEKLEDEEHKSSQLGTAFNFVNQIVGCGIVGIPFAMRESGIFAGVFLLFLSAYLTRKSLHLLVDTAVHVDASTYEALCEAAFGRGGFLSVTVAMFVLAFGSMVSYLMVVRDTLPELVGLSGRDFWPKRALMVAASAVTMFPLSSQRDMADLAKTSTVSVIFDIILVGIIAFFSPLWGDGYDDASADTKGVGMAVRWRDDIAYINWHTLFVGLGVLSFAFVCQHSGFLIAGSLRNPTRSRLRRVTLSALSLCAILAAIIGITGYLGYGSNTEGNILNCFPDDYLPANIARGLLCCTMLFVYPMESFVARHALVVVLFSGRSAKEGDDHAVLARPARRIALTFSLYVLALVPAIAFEDLGNVLALTGALGGSAMSYIGPGLCFLGVYGGEFLELVEERWGRSWDAAGIAHTDKKGNGPSRSRFLFLDELMWHILLMPLWCTFAAKGKRCLTLWYENQATCSPYPSRLGTVPVVHKRRVQRGVVSRDETSAEGKVQALMPPVRTQWRNKVCEDEGDRECVGEDDFKPLLRTGSSPPLVPKEFSCATASYGSFTIDVGANTATATVTAALETLEEEGATFMQAASTWDFFVSIGFFLFGVVAAIAGVLSVFV